MLIILDWDGTLINSADKIAECLVKAGQSLDHYDVDEQHAKQVIGLGLDVAIAQLYPYMDKAMLKECQERYKAFFVEADQQPCQLFDGVKETLDKLKDEGFRLAIATGKSRRGLNRVLDQMQMHHYFESTRCADETASKPAPDMLFELLDECQVEPHQCLMVGDTVFDMEMAKAAGINPVAVNYGVHAEDKLLECEPFALIDQFSKLEQVIEDFMGYSESDYFYDND